MVFLWVALYGVTYIVSEKFSRVMAPAQWITPLAMTLYIGLLIFWLSRTGLSQEIGLCGIRHGMPKDYLFFLPLVLLPIWNLLTAAKWSPELPTAFLMLCVSIAEEIFFRGFMLRFFSKRSKLSGILITSAVFAWFHWVNLFPSGNFAYIMMQVLCAFAAGVCYCAVTLRCGSLLPSVAAHFITNITGAGDPAIALQGWNLLGLWICIAAYGCYGIWLCRKIR